MWSNHNKDANPGHLTTFVGQLCVLIYERGRQTVLVITSVCNNHTALWY